jgi:hypothetical protein
MFRLKEAQDDRKDHCGPQDTASPRIGIIPT